MIGNAGNDARPEPRPDFESELSGLAAALAVARGGFTIIVAVTNGVPTRNRVIERLKEHCPDIVTVELTSEVDDAFDKGVAQAALLKPEALCLVGLELPLLSPARGPVALTAFNAARDLWPKRFSCPVIFWLSDAALHAVIRGAPDFWSRKSHLFEFEEPGGEGQLVWSSPYSSLASDIAIWSDERRRARVIELTARLAQLPPDRPAKEQPQRKRWLNELGFLQDSLGNYLAAFESFETAAKIAREAREWEQYAQHAAWSATEQVKLGDLEMAETILRRCLSDVSSYPSIAKPIPISTFGILYSTLSTVLKEKGEFEEARHSIERALEFGVIALGPTSPNLAAIHNNYGMILLNMGETLSALDQMKKAIDILRLSLDETHPRLAILYSNIGMAYEDIGDLENARRYLNMANRIHEQYFPRDHPTQATSFHNLAIIQNAEGDSAAAANSERRALEILCKHFGDGHPQVMNSRQHLRLYEENASTVPSHKKQSAKRKGE